MASSSSSSDSPHLPDECWESVFRNLTDDELHYQETLSLVSRNFLSITNRLRTSLTLTVTHTVLPLLPALLRRFPNLTSINLTAINLSPSFIADLNAFLTQIASSHLPSLHSLSLHYITAFPSIGLRNFALKFPTLKSLTCYGVLEVEPADLKLIATCFPNLEELDLSYSKLRAQPSVPGDGDGNVEAMFAGAVEAMASGLQKLRKLRLSGSPLHRGPLLLTLCRNCESLEELDLGYNPCHLKEGGIVDAIRERPGLRSLTVHAIFDRRRRIVSSELIDAFLSLKGLTCLDLDYMGLPDVFFCAVADAGLPLRKLKLSACFGFSRFGFSYLFSKCNLLQHLYLDWVKFIEPLEDPFIVWSFSLPNLISLYLSNYGRNLIATELTFLAVVRNCPLITEICMNQTGFGTKKVDEASLTSFAINRHVNRHVKILNLYGNDQLNDESVMIIASVCPNLEKINLGRCRSITDSAALVVLKMCRKITSLKVEFSGVAQFQIDFQVPALLELYLSGLDINDETLSTISKNCCWLKDLKLESCGEITAKGVKKVVENCKHLKMVSLWGCNKVAADVVPWMVFARPSLRMLIHPPSFSLTDSQAELFLQHGCNVTELKC
ncbi:hypothetical protein PIB30_043424 [Stylosanthes scabra]|uniref:F-box/LRR-repeat protein n=1 Tax=Stylosanthes scabra TaxID=79078 RepID=A0ABU6TF61_9FABA|nr:hypothetical protein [Stylosanthes scabra]